MNVEIYFDFKSPYSYIALDELFTLEQELRKDFEWNAINLPLEVMSWRYGNLEMRSQLQNIFI